MFLICFYFYLAGCLLSLLVFLLGSFPALSTWNRTWPVVFLWPALLLWPLYCLVERFLKWKCGPLK
jgi:hypothetical protein